MGAIGHGARFHCIARAPSAHHTRSSASLAQVLCYAVRVTDDADYITADEAASRLNKSASQVRRDARGLRLNSIRKGGRLWIRVDERFKALERDPSTQFFDDANESDAAEAPAASDHELPTSSSERNPQQSFVNELIDEVADLRSDMARLTARIRKLESRLERSA